jgi:lysophospholipase L1-like esterase
MEKHVRNKWSFAARPLLQIAVAITAVMSSFNAPSLQADEDTSGRRWIATWGASPMQPGTAFAPSRSFENQTIRQIVHTSIGGSKVRVRLSNQYGPGALIVGSARVALMSSGDTIVPASDRALTFNGQSTIAIPAGSVAISDPVSLVVGNNADLAISLYVPQNTGEATFHHNAVQTAYISGAGDFTAAVDFPTAETRPQNFWLSFVEVIPSTRDEIGALAVFGDAFTEGSSTTRDANRRPTNYVSAAANLPGGPARLGVINQATACGRLLFLVCGPSGISRFERDVLNAPGISHVVLAIGNVDLFLPNYTGDASEVVSAEQIIAGLRELIRKARARGLVVYGATFTPIELSGPDFYTPEYEEKRQAVNAWIRTTSEFDAVVDFDAAVRDPNRPAALLPEYAFDGLHLNDTGSAVQGQVIVDVLRQTGVLQ